MTTIDFQNITEEILNTLRNGNIFTTAIRGVTTQTDTFTATAGQTIFTLTKLPVKNIRSLTVQAVNKYLFRDYTINWTTGVLTLNTGATLSDAVIIQYDYGSGDKLYPDMPRVDLTLTSFPRIGMQITSSRTEPFGLGGMVHISDILLTVYVWVPANKDTSVGGGLGGTDDLKDLISSVRSILRANAKSFYYFQYVTPIGTAPIIAGTNNKIIQASQDFSIKFVTE